ncbi:MAG: hypothetical protein Q7L19_05760 [Pseudohongiella sp.]|nr:hypothetical protein [Pseudohongiella sp.]
MEVIVLTSTWYLSDASHLAGIWLAAKEAGFWYFRYATKTPTHGFYLFPSNRSITGCIPSTPFAILATGITSREGNIMTKLLNFLSLGNSSHC